MPHQVPASVRSAYLQAPALGTCISRPSRPVGPSRYTSNMGSPQTLSASDRRRVAAWAADCAERVVEIFESALPGDDRPRILIARARTFASGDADVATEIRRRFVGGVPAADVSDPAALAAARAAGQAAAVCHMGAHALGAAAYATQAAGLAAPDRPTAEGDEIVWQLAHLDDAARHALSTLPPVGTDRSGPLGPGLLTVEPRASIIARIQAGLSGSAVSGPASTDHRP